MLKFRVVVDPLRAAAKHYGHSGESMAGSVLRSIWKMRPDGTDDAQAWPMPVFYLSYAVTANALYGVVARDPVRRCFSAQSTRGF